ncbi:MAG: hypothetical protein SGILL_001557, partial [Bacillariaceae sp.]
SNTGVAVIHGQDMALLQRPLLESPSGSDSSKAGDSIGCSVQHAINGDEAKTNKDDTLNRTFSEPESSTPMQDEAETSNRKLSPNGRGHGSDANMFSPNVEESNASLGRKREYSSECGDVFDENRFKKMRSETPPSELVSVATDSKRIENSLGDGYGVPSKLCENISVRYAKIPADDGLTSSPATPSKPAVLQDLSSSGVFDDAEDDVTLRFETAVKDVKDEKAANLIRPDLVATILGSLTTPSTAASEPISATKTVIAAVPITVSKVKTESQAPRKARMTKSPKRVWESKKEQDAAMTILRGKVDLSRVLSDEDCNFLGFGCGIFTLQQLEFVLNEEENVHDVFTRQRLRDLVAEKMLESRTVNELVPGNVRASNHTLLHGPEKEASKFEGSHRDEHEKSLDKNTNALGGATSAATQEESDQSTLSQSLTGSHQVTVAKRMDEWKEKVLSWRQAASEEDIGGQFPLFGALSCFIPKGTRQFFQSIALNDAVDFLSLKKTETGLVVEMFQAWRSKCGVKQVQSIALAKHLMGINSRIEMALTSKCGVNSNDVAWVRDPIVVLTGAAKDFIIDECEIFSAEKFIEMRTKYLADKLELWRASKGLAVLKGSGKVAMVSAWKALLKDEVEISNTVGTVIPKEELRGVIESQVASEAEPRKRKPTTEDGRPREKSSQGTTDIYSTPAARQALNSDAFFLDIFGEDEKNVVMFKSVGITTAQHILDADKGKNSKLLKAVIAMKSERSDGNVQVTSCMRLLYSWANKVKARLDEIENPKPKQTIESVILARPKEQKTSERDRKSLSTDPFDALSASSKDFLASIGIITAEQFLSTRTTDIANAFIIWREEKRMSELKGLGAVASVSGWKKLVRNKAAELGDEDLAQMNQASNFKTTRQAKPRAKPRATTGPSSTPSHRTVTVSSHVGVSKRHKIAALSVSKGIVFHFELDLRSDSKRKETYFLTYSGSDPSSMVPECAALQQKIGARSGLDADSVMLDVGDIVVPASGRRPYESRAFGAIKLRDWSVMALDEEQERGKSLKESILKFLCFSMDATGGDINSNPEMSMSSDPKSLPLSTCEPSTPKSHSQKAPPLEPYTMFDTFHNGVFGRFVFLSEPIEKGQSVKLHCLPETAYQANGCLECDVTNPRGWINEAILKLKSEELVAMFESLAKEVGQPLMEQIDDAHNDGGTEEPGFDSSSKGPMLIKSSRRLHWIAMKFYDKITGDSNLDGAAPSCSCLKRFIWHKPLVERLSALPCWIIDVVRSEVLEEIWLELRLNDEVKGFVGTKNVWCPLALDLFERSMKVFAEFLIRSDSSGAEDELVKELCEMVSTAAEEIKVVVEKAVDAEPSDLHRLALQYSDKIKNITTGKLPPMEKVAGEIHDVDTASHLRIVATRKDNTSLVWKSVKESSKDELDVQWYVETQVLAVILAVVRCGYAAFHPRERRVQRRELIESKIMEAARIALGDPSIQFSTFLEALSCDQQGLTVPRYFQEKSNRKIVYQPHSSPFFHGFIWPLLRDSGWRLFSGNFPSDVVYCPPSASKDKKLVGRIKEKIARQRAQLSRDACSIGFGYIPKVTKRLLIKCTDDMEGEGPPQHETTFASSASAGRVIEMFRSLVFSQFNDVTAREKIVEITDEIGFLFDELGPSTLLGEEDVERKKGEKWRYVLGCQYLMRRRIFH